MSGHARHIPVARRFTFGAAAMALATALTVGTAAAAELPTGLGCWVQKTSLTNTHVRADVFAWYITDSGNMEEFTPPKGKPLYMSFAGKEADRLLAKMDEYKSRIAGVVWDYEHRGTPVDVAERDLKMVYDKAKSFGIPFGVATLANPERSKEFNGVDYRRAKAYADFLMPMLYAQWFGMKRSRLEELIQAGRRATTLPLIGVMALETTKTNPPRRLTPPEILSFYRGLPLNGMAVWNVETLDQPAVRALTDLRK